MPEKPHNFWQELKRRKVVRVVVMYAGAAYVIVEIINNITGPLHLPEWIATLVILLLIVGFPLVAVLSWVFDITPHGIQKTEKKVSEVETTKRRKLRASDIIIAVLLIAVIVLVYPKIFKIDKLKSFRDKGEITIAVMPFQNMSGDESKDFWQEMVQDNLISSLSNTRSLKVRQTESINTLLEHSKISNFASLTTSRASRLSQKLKTNVFIYGSIKQAGEHIRLDAKLIDSETEEVFKSFQFDGQAENILYSADSLSLIIRDYLLVSILGEEVPPDIQSYIGETKSPEALKYVMDGFNAFWNQNFSEAIDLYMQALKLDTSYYTVYPLIAGNYGNLGLIDEAKKWALKAYNVKNKLSPMDKLMAEDAYVDCFGTIHDRIKVVRQILEFDDQDAGHHYLLGILYIVIAQYDQAIQEFERALEIYDQWDIKPAWASFYNNLGYALHKKGLYRKEHNLYRKAEKYFPGDPSLLYRQAILALSTGKTRTADEYIKQCVSTLKEDSGSEAEISSLLGSLYTESELFDKAKEYYREALSLEPENTGRMIDLAYFLIDNDLNIEEGLELVEKALESNPDNFSYLHVRGWGLYKKGKYREALYILQKSWDLRMENDFYNHGAFLHLEAAKKAVASLKSEK